MKATTLAGVLCRLSHAVSIFHDRGEDEHLLPYERAIIGAVAISKRSSERPRYDVIAFSP